jgi:hypothetical protein
MSISFTKEESIEEVQYEVEDPDTDKELFPNVLPSSTAFDENSFNFNLMSSDRENKNYHTDVLIASATFKSGENEGMPVPLNCTWFNLEAGSSNGEFLEIPNATGSCYQPSVEDIGLKVMVHAIPASDVEEYEGMPMFSEIGPLICDP